jgi:hypothetical protein
VLDYGIEEEGTGGNINSQKTGGGHVGGGHGGISRKSRESTIRFNPKYSETNVLSMIEEEEEGLLHASGT